MDFSQTPDRNSEASFVPMINVVFLLLIFFLMTSQITPPEPFEVETPQSANLIDPVGELMLYVSKDGDVQFEDHTGDTAWARLGGRIEPKTTVKLRVDAMLTASELAKIVNRLAPMGAAFVEIIASTP